MMGAYASCVRFASTLLAFSMDYRIDFREAYMGRKLKTLFALIVLVTCAIVVGAQTRVPTIDDLLTLKSAGGTQISPDGKWVAYTVNYGDFKQDAFITQIWLADSGSGKTIQLTRG